jgi:hypothetical protein
MNHRLAWTGYHRTAGVGGGPTSVRQAGGVRRRASPGAGHRAGWGVRWGGASSGGSAFGGCVYRSRGGPRSEGACIVRGGSAFGGRVYRSRGVAWRGGVYTWSGVIRSGESGRVGVWPASPVRGQRDGPAGPVGRTAVGDTARLDGAGRSSHETTDSPWVAAETASERDEGASAAGSDQPRGVVRGVSVRGGYTRSGWRPVRSRRRPALRRTSSYTLRVIDWSVPPHRDGARGCVCVCRQVGV